jgi:hypothetical protein
MGRKQSNAEMNRIHENRLRGPWLCCTLIGASILGCRGDARVPVSPVRGQLMYQGRGIEGATVILHPAEGVDEAANKFRPFANTDAEGRFVLKTYTDDDGAPRGTYRVSVVFAGIRGASSSDDAKAPAAAGSERSSPAIPLSVRQKYSNVDTAGITVTIHEGQNELEPINLE